MHCETARLRSLAQELNTMFPTRARTLTARRSGDERTNHVRFGRGLRVDKNLHVVINLLNNGIMILVMACWKKLLVCW